MPTIHRSAVATPAPSPQTHGTARPARIASVAIVAMLAWLAITNHVPLSPLNDLATQGPQLASTLSGAIPFGLALATIAATRRFLPLLFWTGYAYVWLWLQALTWWVPYLAGDSRDHWSSYETTVSVLPEIGGRPGPDVQHLVLELLTLAVVVSLTWLTARSWAGRRSPTSSRSR